MRVPDESARENRRLAILSPPGDVVGLAHAGRVTLRVAYETLEGEPIPRAEVRFGMVATGAGENAAGSTLSASTAITDEAGVARVDLAAGGENTSFRVSADAADAPTVRFTVFVSDQGFATLSFTPRHDGFRALEVFERVEARLFSSETVTCAALDIDAMPESTFPPRSVDRFDEALTYQSLAAGGGYTLVAWARAAGSDTPLAAGCADLSTAVVRPGRARLEVAVRDREPTLADTPLAVWWDLRPVADAIAAAGADRAWRVLACPAGPGQILLDCALDAVAPDGALDCRPTPSGPLATAIATRRGARAANGCRPLTLPGGGDSLDRAITDAVAAGGEFPVAAALAQLTVARSDALASFISRSELSAASGEAARHRLLAAEVPVGVEIAAVDLVATSRPVLEQSRVAAPIADGRLALAAHGFTLRHGEVAREVFTAVGLAPVGLDDREGDLGRALAESVLGAGGMTGCAGLSAIACGAIGDAPSCLQAACGAGAAELDQELTAWYRAATGTGIDFSLAGTAQLLDADFDLRADAVGIDESGAPTATLSATMTLASGAAVPVLGVPVP